MLKSVNWIFIYVLKKANVAIILIQEGTGVIVTVAIVMEIV